LVAVLLRPCRRGAGARPFDLAPLSQAGGAGLDPSPRPSTSAAATPLCGAISRRAFRRRGQAASGTVVATARTQQGYGVTSQAATQPTPARANQGAGGKGYGGATRAAR